MKLTIRFATVALAVCASASLAHAANWSTYRIPETGTSVEIPASVFSEPAGRPEGYGQRFQTADGSADLTVQSVPKVSGDSPAAFLARKHPPRDIVYKRVTPRFFVVSSIKEDTIWYDRCNFSSRFVHCVLINYPKAEKRRWDGIVTRISHTLTGG